MHFSLKFGAALGLATLGLAALPAAQAQVAPAYYTGVFSQDDTFQLFDFTVTTPGTVKLYTTSYGGGLNVDGSTSAAGGFDPILSLFDSSGNLVDENDDSPIANFDPVTGAAFDAGLQDTLAAGTYQVAVTEYNNFTNDTQLADGFVEDGQGNFTGSDFGSPEQAGLGFIDVTGAQRTANFNLNITNGAFPAVPEASTTVSFGLLLALGLGGIVLARKKKAMLSA